MKTETVFKVAGPLGSPLHILRQSFPSVRKKPTQRISFVAGLHGDELEGLYLCHRLIQALKQLQQTTPDAFQGEVTIYPAVNPAALNSATRLWPYYSVDLNRTVGNRVDSSLPVQTTQALLDDLKAHSDLVVDLHASNLYLQELPQVRIIEDYAHKLVPLAKLTQVDLVWVHPMAGLFESTLGFNLNMAKIPTLVIETGICLRIDRNQSDRLFSGLMNLLRETGVLNIPAEDSADEDRAPLVIYPRQVAQSCAQHSGMFLSEIQPGDWVRKGDCLGQVVDTTRGDILQTVEAPEDGLLFTLREHPLVYQGALLARIALTRDLES